MQVQEPSFMLHTPRPAHGSCSLMRQCAFVSWSVDETSRDRTHRVVGEEAMVAVDDATEMVHSAYRAWPNVDSKLT